MEKKSENPNWLKEAFKEQNIVKELLELDGIINDAKTASRQLKSLYARKRQLFKEGDIVKFTRKGSDKAKIIKVVAPAHFQINDNGLADVVFPIKFLNENLEPKTSLIDKLFLTDVLNGFHQIIHSKSK